MKGKFKKTVAIVAVSAVTAMTAMFTGCSFVDKVKEEIDHHFGDKGGAETVCEFVDEDSDDVCDSCGELGEYATVLANFVENFNKGEYIYEFAEIPNLGADLIGKIVVFEFEGENVVMGGVNFGIGSRGLIFNFENLSVSVDEYTSDFDGILMSPCYETCLAVYFYKDFYLKLDDATGEDFLFSSVVIERFNNVSPANDNGGMAIFSVT